jgi:hypothetical protein
LDFLTSWRKPLDAIPKPARATAKRIPLAVDEIVFVKRSIASIIQTARNEIAADIILNTPLIIFVLLLSFYFNNKIL